MRAFHRNLRRLAFGDGLPHLKLLGPFEKTAEKIPVDPRRLFAGILPDEFRLLRHRAVESSAESFRTKGFQDGPIRLTGKPQDAEPAQFRVKDPGHGFRIPVIHGRFGGKQGAPDQAGEKGRNEE